MDLQSWHAKNQMADLLNHFVKKRDFNDSRFHFHENFPTSLGRWKYFLSRSVVEIKEFSLIGCVTDFNGKCLIFDYFTFVQNMMESLQALKEYLKLRVDANIWK